MFLTSFSIRFVSVCFCHMTRHLIDKLLTKTVYFEILSKVFQFDLCIYVCHMTRDLI